MTVKLLTELHLELLTIKGSCTGSSESTLVKMPHFWKSSVAAQLCNGLGLFFIHLIVYAAANFLNFLLFTTIHGSMAYDGKISGFVVLLFILFDLI